MNPIAFSTDLLDSCAEEARALAARLADLTERLNAAASGGALQELLPQAASGLKGLQHAIGERAGRLEALAKSLGNASEIYRSAELALAKTAEGLTESRAFAAAAGWAGEAAAEAVSNIPSLGEYYPAGFMDFGNDYQTIAPQWLIDDADSMRNGGMGDL